MKGIEIPLSIDCLYLKQCKLYIHIYVIFKSMQENIIMRARVEALQAFVKACVKRSYPIEKHLDEIADDLRKVGAEDFVIAAGYLHDAPAYTDLSVSKITEIFGSKIGNLVDEVYAAAVMDIKDDIELRKNLQAERMLNASNGAKAVKIADQRSNIMQGFNGQSEGEVDIKKKLAYLEGAKVVADACTENGDVLVKNIYKIFLSTYSDLKNELK